MDHPSHKSDVVFRAFDRDAEVEYTERNLPHWFQPGVAVFITFRTADSMPSHVIERWRREQEEWLQERKKQLSSNTAPISSTIEREYKRLQDRLWHQALDAGHGECALRLPHLAQIVGNAMLHFDGDRYDLDSFVVMPNHVHILVQFRPPTTLRGQTASWLRYSARKINEQLGRRGAFWQAEPFDHLVRSAQQFEYLRQYIFNNPAKAKLRSGEYLYWSRTDSRNTLSE